MTPAWIASLALLAISALLAPPASAFDPWKEEARYEFVYRIDVASIPATDGQRVSLWIPLAAESNDQQLLFSAVDAPFPWRSARTASATAWRT